MRLTKTEWAYAQNLGTAWPYEPENDLREAINLWTGGECSAAQLDQLTGHAVKAQKNERESLEKRTTGSGDLEKWKAVADLGADLAMRVQSGHGAPRSIVKRALDLIELHRDLRPEIYGPRIEQKPRKERVQ